MDKLVILIIIAVVAYYLYTQQTKSSNYSLPSEYVNSGSKGLTYLEQQYASQLSQARSLCENQFKGTWSQTSNSLGCYNMQGFSTIYCNTQEIQQITSICKQIGGNAVCSSDQASCTV